jgi:hypothetical protein
VAEDTEIPTKETRKHGKDRKRYTHGINGEELDLFQIIKLFKNLPDYL